MFVADKVMDLNNKTELFRSDIEDRDLHYLHNERKIDRMKEGYMHPEATQGSQLFRLGNKA